LERDGRRPAEAPVMPDAPSASAPLIDVRGLGFARDDIPLFGPLDFSVEAGEALMVQGGNGAGKTTLLRVLAGLLDGGRGEVRLRGVPAAAAAARAGQVAYLGHLPGLKADLGAVENLE